MTEKERIQEALKGEMEFVELFMILLEAERARMKANIRRIIANYSLRQAETIDEVAVCDKLLVLLEMAG